MLSQDEAGLPECGRKGTAARLCCGWSWKPELWGRDILLRDSYVNLAWMSWVGSGWLSRTGVGREAGKKMSRCSLLYLGVVGASPADCWTHKGKVVKRRSRGLPWNRLILSLLRELWVQNDPHSQTAYISRMSPGSFTRRADQILPSLGGSEVTLPACWTVSRGKAQLYAPNYINLSHFPHCPFEDHLWRQELHKQPATTASLLPQWLSW